MHSAVQENHLPRVDPVGEFYHVVTTTMTLKYWGLITFMKRSNQYNVVIILIPRLGRFIRAFLHPRLWRTAREGSRGGAAPSQSASKADSKYLQLVVVAEGKIIQYGMYLSGADDLPLEARRALPCWF